MERLFCKEVDPLVAVLKDWLRAEILRIPNGEVKPLLVIERAGQQLHPRGKLSRLLTHPERFLVGDGEIQKDYMADLSGVRSRKANLAIGIKIANNFLKGFGVNSGIESLIQGATTLSFSFSNVYKCTFDNGLLGTALKYQSIDKSNPVTAGFFTGSDLLVVDSIITSDNFSIHIADEDKVDLSGKAAEIEKLFKASATLKVEEIAKTTISFKREIPLPFAFTCLKFNLDEAGRIVGMPPVRKLPVFGEAPEFEKEVLSEGFTLLDID
ncbi:gasdermin [Spirosoma litoris]